MLALEKLLFLCSSKFEFHGIYFHLLLIEIPMNDFCQYSIITKQFIDCLGRRMRGLISSRIVSTNFI